MSVVSFFALKIDARAPPRPARPPSTRAMDEEDLPLLNEEPARRRRRRRKTQTCCGCFAWDTCKWILWIAAGAAGAWIVYHLYLHYFGGTSDSHAEFTRVKAMRYATFASATYAPLNEVKAWDCKECVKSDVVPRNITVVETTPLFDGRVDVFTITPLGEPSKLVVAFRGETTESAAAWMGIEHAFAEATFGPQYANVKVRSIHWSPYDPVRVVNADP